MRFLAKRPALFALASAIATFIATVPRCGPHEWA
jgi:hypothetical protein